MKGEVKVVNLRSAWDVGDTASLVDENGNRWDLYIKDSQLKLKPVPKPKPILFSTTLKLTPKELDRLKEGR